MYNFLYFIRIFFFNIFFFFHIFVQNIDCGYTSESPHRGDSNEYPQSMFWIKIISEYKLQFINDVFIKSNLICFIFLLKTLIGTR